MRLSDYKQTDRFKLCVYGLSGAGKTTFASGFPGPIYFADFDGKIGSAANYLEAHNKEKLKEIEFDNFQPSSENGGMRVFHKFEKTLSTLEELSKNGKFPFKTFVLDSLTTYSDMLMTNIMLSNPGIKRMDSRTPAMQDYLLMNSHFKSMVYRMLSLPCNVVIIGHLSQDKDETTGMINYRPALSGKLPELLPTLFEEVYYAYVDTVDGKPVHIAQTRSMNRFTARTQHQNMPNKIPLNYEYIKKVLNKEI